MAADALRGRQQRTADEADQTMEGTGTDDRAHDDLGDRVKAQPDSALALRGELPKAELTRGRD